MNSTTAPTGPPRRVWRYWVAGAVTVLVALGAATAVALQPQPSPGPSRSELALRSAQDDAARLAAWARSAEGTRQTTAGARDALASAASVLGKQASLLASRPGASASADPPRSASSGGASGSGSAGSGSAGSGSGPGSAGSGGSPGEVVARLTASVDARLAALPDVDGPTAALLASLAAGQSLQADGIAAAAGLSPQQPQQPSATAASSTPTPSPCPSAPAAATAATGAAAATRQSAAATIPSPAAPAVSAASGVSFADALAAVDRAEAASEYALETALARSAQGSPDATARAAALDAHRRQLTAVAALASAACVALPVQDAGFAVPQGFATDPTPALAAVAESAAESWAQLVGAAPADRRVAAAQGLFAAGKLAASAAPSSAPAFPGLPAAN